MKYTHNHFKTDYPEWKRKKDSWLVRNFLRPISFYFASFFANRNIMANQVSFISLFVGALAAALYLFQYKTCHIVGAILVILWMILDCTDGDLARSVKKQSYGDFADGISSYVLINVLFLCIGVAAYFDGGILAQQGNVWILVCGAFAGSLDSLARLIYQKFINCQNSYTKNTEEMSEDLVDADKQKGIRYIHRRFTREVGLNGLFLPTLLICSIANWLDVFIIFYLLVFLSTFVGTLITLMRRVMKINREE